SRAPAQAPAPAASPATSAADAVAAGPAVRRFAREVGVDLATVAGSDPSGRITRDDVLRAVRESQANRTAPASGAMTAPSTAAGGHVVVPAGEIAQDDYGPVRVERLSKIRKTIAMQMHKSWSTVPRVTNFDDADVTDLEIFRQSSKDDYAAQG